MRQRIIKEVVIICAILLVAMGVFCAVILTIAKEFGTP